MPDDRRHPMAAERGENSQTKQLTQERKEGRRMPLSFSQTVELLDLSRDEVLTLHALKLFPAGERLDGSCHLMFPRASIDVFVFELRQRGELYENVKLALGRPLNI
ncbi:hypothetical protein KYK29_15645 [Shinella daejeonensis]|uniref:hypothetical protein n=1 Tax=Shinella daejeonensis TaxID=659017 RepID=UPI0020C7D94C|nr:hypothetical protein [Shinella daejeonensis]MCP8896361.1 hypothetical protein [Shinella daejeonensis]